MGRELLLIESDPVVAESVLRTFAPAGFQVATLGAGESAVDRCRTSRPDVVLLSAELPDMSGFSVCNRIKRTVTGIPVILYTGEDADAAVAAHRLTRTRADEYVRAPLDLGSVLARVTQLIGDASGLVEQTESLALPTATPAPPAAGTSDTTAAPPRRIPAPPPPLPRPPPDEPASEIVDELLPDWPAEGPAAGDMPELDFLRERVRAKDAFLTRVKDAMETQRAEASELRERAEALRRQLVDAERARAEVERMLGEARGALEQSSARGAELERRLQESETTRQALSDVLSETMQQSEASEREWSQRLSRSEEGRAQVEQAIAERNAAVAALESERVARAGLEAREADRERIEQAKAEIESRTKDALVDLERRLEASARAEGVARRRIAELEKDRAERSAQGDRLASAEPALAQARAELEDLRTENDFLNGEVARYAQKNRDLLAQLQQRT